MTLFFSPAFKRLSRIRSELIAFEAIVVLSGRWALRTRAFATGICPERGSVRGKCSTGDDSIAYDRSFA